MFKNLGNIIDRRRRTLRSTLDEKSKITVSLEEFLNQCFGDALKGFSIGISYNHLEKTLILKTDNKIIANEISLKLVELEKFMKDRKILLDRVIIR